MKYAIIIQARIGSQRPPKKILLKIDDKITVLEFIIQMNIFFTLKKQLQKKQILYLSILIFLMIFISIFEIIGLGSVPILLGSILKQNYLLEANKSN